MGQKYVVAWSLTISLACLPFPDLVYQVPGYQQKRPTYPPAHLNRKNSHKKYIFGTFQHGFSSGLSHLSTSSPEKRVMQC